MSAQTKGLAALLAAQGRYGDDELIHVNKRELAALERLGNKHGIATTTNPRTGLKEAFNWLSTLGGIAGGVAGTFIAPGAGTAAGAALGSGLGTAAGGGSTEEALTNGLISGVTAYAGAGLADSLAQAGAEAGKAGLQEGTKAVVQEGVEEGIKAGVGSNAPTNALFQAAPTTAGVTPTPSALPADALFQPAGAAPSALPTTPQGIQALNTAGNTQANLMLGNPPPPVAEGMTPQAGTVVGDKFVPGSPSPVAEAPKMSMPGSSGQIPMAERAADYWSDVGAGIKSLDTPGKIGDFAMANRGSLIGTATGIAGIATAPESSSTADESTGDSYTGPSYRGEVYYTPYGERRTRAVPYAGGGGVWGDYDGGEEEYAGGGGISSLGSYSDGGQLLRGAGDGVSDSIPASIEGKRPARLADGEFVIPARAVSELGNGSTEAGSKQLYAMLDRIAKKRKKGSGLAYQANPKKLMPV